MYTLYMLIELINIIIMFVVVLTILFTLLIYNMRLNNFVNHHPVNFALCLMGEGGGIMGYSHCVYYVEFHATTSV